MVLDFYQESFQKNWNDWLLGGPHEGGWTRTGPAITTNRKFFLRDIRFDYISVDDSLAKNKSETERWHLSFLADHQHPEDTAYWNEYLLPRMDQQRAKERIKRFIRMFETFTTNGILPLWVADFSTIDNTFKFEYFRFDGCHRSCCAKTKGVDRLPAFIFSLEDRAFLL